MSTGRFVGVGLVGMRMGVHCGVKRRLGRTKGVRFVDVSARRRRCSAGEKSTGYGCVLCDGLTYAVGACRRGGVGPGRVGDGVSGFGGIRRGDGVCGVVRARRG